MTTILFVCTGNTCRSPMAACLMNALCASRGRTDVRAISAGVAAPGRVPASEGAKRAMARRGLSLDPHRAQSVTERLLRDCSLVVGVSERHLQAIRQAYPSVSIPMRAFSPSIPDPFGGNDAAYEQAACAMAAQLEDILSSIKEERA